MKCFKIVCAIFVSFFFVTFGDEQEQKGIVIGVDVGTSYSRVGVFLNGKVKMLSDELGNHEIPSWVALTDSGQLIGESAKIQINQTNVVFDISRLIGGRFDYIRTQDWAMNWPFEIIDKEGEVQIEIYAEGKKSIHSPKEIYAIILKKLKKIAEDFLEKPVIGAVVTCPSTFGHAKRQAVRDAGDIAGLKVLQVLDTSTAVAVSYGVNNLLSAKDTHYVLVYDLGGGTCSVSLLEVENNVFKVLATNGEAYLGGSDFDRNIATDLFQAWRAKTGSTSRLARPCTQRLLLEAERAKLALSADSVNEVAVALEDFCEGQGLNETLTRARFEALNDELFRRTLESVRAVLKSSHMERRDVTDVVLVGGSSNIPKVRLLLKEFFRGSSAQTRYLYPSSAAYGAAMQAAVLSKHQYQSLTQNLTVTNGTFIPRRRSEGRHATGDRKEKFAGSNSTMRVVLLAVLLTVLPILLCVFCQE